ncbi:glutathione s-transferase omega 2 [Fusarium heterosporum]|uniref:Glutathione s-transferase omega 2 n=1 Tax=Fusarium heterosporum TaxID=42747 RepID=A0A8H5T595_FUSHE|nr:glutathione s-transferase omega 2 [Fusarium heterosporum]
MTPETFSQFQKLPNEIQILIWEAAVRPVPGDRHVHSFFIADYHLTRPSPLHPINKNFLHLLRTKATAYASMNYASGFSLAIPIDDIDGNRNDSVYLSDSSLWTLCKESRRAMERKFPKNEWWSHIRSPFHPKRTAAPGEYLGHVGASHTASYEEDGVAKHITIDFDKDLVHLDPRYLRNIDWFHLHQGVNLPIFDYRTAPSPNVKLSFIGDNIALDYDHSMVDILNRKRIHYRQKELGMSIDDFNDMLSLLCGVAKRTIWFIDYGFVQSAQIMKDVAEDEDGPSREIQAIRDQRPVREVFRSNNFVYTEVKREDVGSRWLSRNYEAGNGEISNAFDMLDILSQQNIFEDEDLGRLRVLARQSVSGRSIQPRKPWAKRCPGPSICDICGPEKPIPRMRPSTIKREGSGSSTDISMSDLNLFD